MNEPQRPPPRVISTELAQGSARPRFVGGPPISRLFVKRAALSISYSTIRKCCRFYPLANLFIPLNKSADVCRFIPSQIRLSL